MKKCIEHNFIDTRGEIIDMFSFRRKRNRNYAENRNEHDKTEELSLEIKQLREITEQLVKDNSKRKWKFLFELISLIILVITTYNNIHSYFNTQFSDVNERIDNCLTEKDIESLKTSVDKIKLWVEGDINNSNLPGADRRLEKMEELLKITPIDVKGSGIASNLLYNSGMEENNSAVPTSLTPTTYLGKDSNGNQYNIEDIINKKVLLTYNEKDKEIYFWGELNDQLYWHGECLTNVYNSDGTLYGICESTFKNGNREKYESFYISSNENEWIYTNRTCTDQGNLGISERYLFTLNEIKNFTSTNVRIYDLLYINDFSSKNDKTLLTYYYGYTKNGTYNDQSNDKQHISYEIIFNPDGKVRILYIGEFLNGKFDDHTGNAIEIVYDPSNKDYKYFCYNGTFTKGNRDGNVSSDNYITHEQIGGILLEKGIDLKLDWYK